MTWSCARWQVRATSPRPRRRERSPFPCGQNSTPPSCMRRDAPARPIPTSASTSCTPSPPIRSSVPRRISAMPSCAWAATPSAPPCSHRHRLQPPPRSRPRFPSTIPANGLRRSPWCNQEPVTSSPWPRTATGDCPESATPHITSTSIEPTAARSACRPVQPSRSSPLLPHCSRACRRPPRSTHPTRTPSPDS